MESLGIKTEIGEETVITVLEELESLVDQSFKFSLEAQIREASDESKGKVRKEKMEMLQMSF